MRPFYKLGDDNQACVFSRDALMRIHPRRLGRPAKILGVEVEVLNLAAL